MDGHGHDNGDRRRHLRDATHGDGAPGGGPDAGPHGDSDSGPDAGPRDSLDGVPGAGPDAGPHGKPGSERPPGKQPRLGDGQMQWNTWGWFGGQLGSTVWLLVLGLVALAQGDVLGVVPIALCVLANIVGTLLWWARDRLAPFAALEVLLGTITLLSAVGVATILEGGLLGSSPDLPPGRWIYLYLLVFPALMVQLWVIDHAARGRRGGDDGEDDRGDTRT